MSEINWRGFQEGIKAWHRRYMARPVTYCANPRPICNVRSYALPTKPYWNVRMIWSAVTTIGSRRPEPPVTASVQDLATGDGIINVYRTAPPPTETCWPIQRLCTTP